MLDDLNELKTFRAIIVEGSLSAAARKLGVALSVVSKRLTTLEARVGTRLVHRTTRALSPTEDGSRLLTEIERALDALEAGENVLRGGLREPVGTLRVTAPVSFGRRFVAPVLGRISFRYRRLKIELTLTDHVANIVAQSLDVAIRIGRLPDSTAVMLKLADNRRILVASPAYLDQVGRPATPDEAAGLSFLRYGDAVAPWQLNSTSGDSAAISAPFRLAVDNGDVVHEWAVAGHGIMLKSEVDVAEDIAAGRLERVLPDWHGGDAPIVALYPSARHLPLKTRIFLDEMAAVFHSDR